MIFGRKSFPFPLFAVFGKGLEGGLKTIVMGRSFCYNLLHMKYAVIESGGKQYRVSEGETLLVDLLKGDKNQKINFPHVLLFKDEDSVKIGTPYLSNCTVAGRIVDNVKGEKIRVMKFKSKVHYRRATGFRSRLSKVMIEKISPEVGSKTSKSKV